MLPRFMSIPKFYNKSFICASGMEYFSNCFQFTQHLRNFNDVDNVWYMNHLEKKNFKYLLSAHIMLIENRL